MTNEQLYLAIGLPMLFNAAMTGLLIAFLKKKFDRIDRRFDESIEGWRSEVDKLSDA